MSDFYTFFQYKHLPPHLQDVSKPFCELAELLIEKINCDKESTSNEFKAGLRKLLEAKDCFVRAKLIEDK